MRWLPRATAVVDFYHASRAIEGALSMRAMATTMRQGRAQFEKLRHVLREDPDGVQKVIRSLDYQRKRFPAEKAHRRGACDTSGATATACAMPMPRHAASPSVRASSRQGTHDAHLSMSLKD